MLEKNIPPIFFSISIFVLRLLFFLFFSSLALKVIEGERQVIIGINYHGGGAPPADTTTDLHYKQISKEAANLDHIQKTFVRRNIIRP